MAARHLDEGLLGWLIVAGGLTFGAGLCGLGAYLGARLAGVVNHLAEFGD